jgi:hypothetical protein
MHKSSCGNRPQKSSAVNTEAHLLRILIQVHLPSILTAHKSQALYFQRDFSFKIWFAYIVSPYTSSQSHFSFKIITFWDVMPCSLVDRSKHLGGICSSIIRDDWRQQVPPKRWLLSWKLHIITHLSIHPHENYRFHLNLLDFIIIRILGNLYK